MLQAGRRRSRLSSPGRRGAGRGTLPCFCSQQLVHLQRCRRILPTGSDIFHLEMSKRPADALNGVDAVITSSGVQGKLDDEIQITMLGSGALNTTIKSTGSHTKNIRDILIRPSIPPPAPSPPRHPGQEVGRSCCLIKYRGRTIVCDAGRHPGLPGIAALPYVDEVDWSTVDAILVTQ